MRRWSMVMASAAFVMGTVVAAGPVEAGVGNAVCRHVTNDARRLVHDAGLQMNQELNQERNSICKNLFT